MSAVQPILYPAGGIILIQPNIKNVGNSALGYPYLKASHPHASASCKFLQDKLHPRLIYNTSKNKRSASVLVFGKKGDSMSDNEELLKKAQGNFRRELTVQDLLREYTKKKKFSGNGGGGNSFRGGGDGSGGPEGEGFSAQYEELLQVILAAIGVILLYVLITKGEELTLLCRDYIRYLFGAKASARLIRTMEKWHT
ncbi:uncharacterized protein LOC141818885 [Curcuma longa]|uniref:uncharacterized protein LOC141818885 n=1 Tax=Curcuma longa TaxID=136217 RepID=UPI003D9E78DE